MQASSNPASVQASALGDSENESQTKPPSKSHAQMHSANSLSLSLSSRHRHTPRSYAHAVAPVRRITRTAAQDRVAPPFRDHIFERGRFNFLHLTTATHECCHDRGRTSPEGRPGSARRPVHACHSGRTNLHAKRPSTRGQRSRAPTISAPSILCQRAAPVMSTTWRPTARDIPRLSATHPDQRSPPQLPPAPSQPPTSRWCPTSTPLRRRAFPPNAARTACSHAEPR